MIVLATTSDKSCMSQLGLFDVFDSHLLVPMIRDLGSVINTLKERSLFSDVEIDRISASLQPMSNSIAISIKKLLIICELARQDEANAVNRFVALFEEHILSAQ